MKKNIYFCLLLVLITIYNSCTENSNRFFFTISEDQRIIVPVHLNESITANMLFDSGAVDGVFRLDSSFVATHPSVVPGVCPDTALGGLALSTFSTRTLIYNTPITVKIGATPLTYNRLYIYDWRKVIHTNSSDGIFNMPQNDTVHVWEWNFEHNYLKIHMGKKFKMPENCFICPIEAKGYYAYYIRLPLRIKYADGDTLLIDQLYLVDTGAGSDVALSHPAEERSFFDQKEDAVWFTAGYDYYRRYTVTATLFDDHVIDSLRVYTWEKSFGTLGKYVIGLNFLKRFNVFFDRKRQVIGLQPVKNFRRIGLKDARRFYYSAPKNSDGKFIVTKVANYKGNYYKTAGLREGDEIVAVNDTLYKNISFEQYIDFYKEDTLIFDVLRNGMSLKIEVLVDKNEEQGD